MKKILITGGAGFIGSHVIRLFVNKYPHYEIYNLDKLTYAGNLENLQDVENKPNYHFIKADIVEGEKMLALFKEHQFDGVIHLAAESHVDRSIENPMEFIYTNVVGTVNLLNAARAIWKNNMDRIYIKDLEIYAYHGMHEEEKAIGQKFLVSVEIYFPLKKCGKDDDIKKTVNYSELCRNIEMEFSQYKYNLIEKSAEELAGYVLMNYPLVEKVKVLVKKPWAPIGKHLDHVAVEIERSWHKVYIGLGSNMGDKEKNIKNALIISDGAAFIVNTASNIVVTTMNNSEMRDSVITNIDGTVIL